MFSLLDMLLYIMMQILWIGLSVRFVAWLFAKCMKRYCWECEFGVLQGDATKCGCSKSNSVPCGRIKQKEWYQRRLKSSVRLCIAVFLILFSLGMLLSVLREAVRFWKYKVDAYYIFNTLPSSFLDIALAFIAGMVISYTVSCIRKDWHNMKTMWRIWDGYDHEVKSK